MRTIYRRKSPGLRDGYPELTARDGQAVEILRPLTQAEADLDETGPMFRVRSADGLEHDVFEEELEREEAAPS